MPLAREAFLLFVLNMLDAFLTVLWVRNGVAGEGNRLMEHLLDFGDFPFLMVKFLMGALVALVVLRWNDFRIARYGLSVAILVYVSLMGVHLVTGLEAFGYISANFPREILPSAAIMPLGLF
jgi:hypothetical protein